MSVREEDKQKSCPSRGLGLAAAAIGVGVGAALYYFFSKRPENPDSEGSTSQGWSCEQPQTLGTPRSHTMDRLDDSYITISENDTTDTSINNNSEFVTPCRNCVNDGIITIDSEDDYLNTSSNFDTSCNDCQNYTNGSSLSSDSEFLISTDDSLDGMDSDHISFSDSEESETGYLSRTDSAGSSSQSTEAETGDSEWDVTNSSIDVPSLSSTPMIHEMTSRLLNFVSPRHKPSNEEEQIRILREQAFRERRWSLEECSICFEVMLKDQDLVALPCTHNFHVPCIGPWLQEQQTCPVCRKPVE